MNLSAATITIDGIPLGSGFGVEIVPDDDWAIYQRTDLGPVKAWSTTPMVAWLTRRVAQGRYERDRLLPPDACIEARTPTKYLIFQSGRGTITTIQDAEVS